MIYDWTQINACGLGGKGQYYVGVDRVGEEQGVWTWGSLERVETYHAHAK